MKKIILIILTLLIFISCKKEENVEPFNPGLPHGYIHLINNETQYGSVNIDITESNTNNFNLIVDTSKIIKVLFGPTNIDFYWLIYDTISGKYIKYSNYNNLFFLPENDTLIFICELPK